MLGGGCQTIAWTRLVSGSLALDAGGIPICGTGGQPILRFTNNRLSGSAQIGAVTLGGNSGGTMLGIETAGGSVDLGAQSFGLNDIKIRLAGAGDGTQLLLDRIGGQAVPTGR